MKPWVQLGREPAASGVGELTLYQRDREFVIRVDGYELMTSRRHGSEERLAEIGSSALSSGAHVLVGGLGMGFTLRAALQQLPADGVAVIAEISPAVLEWNRTVLGPLADHPLDDPRVCVHVGDVAEPMRAGPGRFASILLDVDNSPHALVRAANSDLYGERGLKLALGALSPGGRLAVWSATEAPEFVKRLRRVGFDVEVHDTPAHPSGRGGTHTIFLGTRRR